MMAKVQVKGTEITIYSQNENVTLPRKSGHREKA
jgi:hypothetical protein